MRFLKRATLLVYLVVQSTVIAGGSGARDWLVHPDGSGDAPTIQAAIDSSQAGDRVLAFPGTYYESIRLKADIEVLGAGAAATTLEGQHVDFVVFGADRARIAGFRITGASVAAVLYGDFDVSPCSPVIEDNILECYYGVDGYVPYQEGPVTPIIRHNLIQPRLTGVRLDEQAYADGGVNAIIENNTFIGSTTSSHSAIQYRAHLSLPEVRDNIITGWRYGIDIVYCALLEERLERIHCNDLWRNTEDYHEEGYPPCPFDLTGIQGNLSADPLFCIADPRFSSSASAFSLHADSPCLPGNHPDGYDCGLVGAYDQGCGAAAIRCPIGGVSLSKEPVVVVARNWGVIKALFR